MIPYANRSFALFFSTLFFLSAAIISSSLHAGNQKSISPSLNEHAPEQTNPLDCWITIFIHGIMGIKPYLSIPNCIRLWKDTIDDTVYKTAVDMIRSDSYFYQNQAMQDIGLQPIDRQKKVGNASGAMAFIFKTFYEDLGIPDHYYYTFGWSGLLSAESRCQAANQFFDELSALDTQLKREGCIPHFQLIGYSHGGNVCLNLAKIKAEKDSSSPLKIDQLILVGTPIIHETDYLINDPLFGHIYNIYSVQDHVQALDIFSSKTLFSSRTFCPRSSFQLPDNLTQIELQVVRNKRSSRQKIDCCFGDPLPHHKELRRASPGHAELWLFGWTPHNYRRKYALYPLPTIALTPFIIAHLQSLPQRRPKKSWRVTIMPEHERITFAYPHTNPRTFKFLEKEKLKTLKKEILGYAPENYARLYYHKVKEATQSARQSIHFARQQQ